MNTFTWAILLSREVERCVITVIAAVCVQHAQPGRVTIKFAKGMVIIQWTIISLTSTTTIQAEMAIIMVVQAAMVMETEEILRNRIF